MIIIEHYIGDDIGRCCAEQRQRCDDFIELSVLGKIIEHTLVELALSVHARDFAFGCRKIAVAECAKAEFVGDLHHRLLYLFLLFRIGRGKSGRDAWRAAEAVPGAAAEYPDASRDFPIARRDPRRD